MCLVRKHHRADIVVSEFMTSERNFQRVGRSQRAQFVLTRFPSFASLSTDLTRLRPSVAKYSCSSIALTCCRSSGLTSGSAGRCDAAGVVVVLLLPAPPVAPRPDGPGNGALLLPAPPPPPALEVGVPAPPLPGAAAASSRFRSFSAASRCFSSFSCGEQNSSIAW